MRIEKFQNDDAGYLTWVAANPAGYVINIQRSLNGSDARLHHADCRFISGDNARRGPWTGPYVKLCSLELGDLDQWAAARTGAPIERCRNCWPPVSRAPDSVPRFGQRRAAANPRVTEMAPVSARPPEIQGPIVGQPVVEAWIDQYIRFEHRSAEQGSLRTEIRARVRQLKSRPDEILQAAFLGDKHPAADVENLVLYYIDDTGASFTDAAKVGLRFELGPEPGPSPTRKKYAYGYRYELVKCDSSLRYWQEGRALASWDWIDLGPFSGPKQLEQVWLALARAQVETSRPCRSPETPFAVRLSIRVPRGVTPVLGGLVKGVVDGVVCAFQAHIDLSNVDELARRVSRSVSATPEEIRDVLVSEQNAVLGAVPRLLHNRGQGVIWSPADDLCVAGELFADPASDQGWSIKGSITELLPT